MITKFLRYRTQLFIMVGKKTIKGRKLKIIILFKC